MTGAVIAGAVPGGSAADEMPADAAAAVLTRLTADALQAGLVAHEMLDDPDAVASRVMADVLLADSVAHETLADNPVAHHVMACALLGDCVPYETASADEDVKMLAADDDGVHDDDDAHDQNQHAGHHHLPLHPIHHSQMQEYSKCHRYTTAAHHSSESANN